ncbi:MAG: hypothetical protein HYV40_05345 [Candidatus Levybacteria bacterium]|nr:hypothetical protein [Candidatus Levybacteria bacterium]
MNITDLFPFLDGITLEGIVKIPLLLLLGMYIIFALILLNKTRSLGRLIFLKSSIATVLLNTLALLHVLAALLLFVLTLVIL